MSKCNVIAIDLAKNLFQVCKTSPSGQVIYNKQVSREKLKALLTHEQPALVAMESCGGTHYWARYAQEKGHQVKAMSARQVKAFRHGQKTDANDALAIAVAARQPHIQPSRLLSVAEQCLQGMDSIRDLLTRQKVAISNQIRTLLLELGHPIAKGDAALSQAVPALLEDAENALTGDFRACLHRQWQHFKEVLAHLDEIETRLTQHTQSDRICKRLKALEGVGPVCALQLKIVLANPGHFKNGRQAAACIGTTPVQHSSGGKQKIGSISKVNRNNKLRSALYEGALAVVTRLEKRESRTVKEQWLKQIIARRGVKVAAIALANKTVRTAYAMLKNDTDYQPTLLAA